MKRTQRVFNDLDALRYVDDRLDDERRAAFRLHLAGNPEAAARVQLWARQNERLRGTFAGVTAEPAPLWLRLDQLSPETDRPDPPRAPVGAFGSAARVARLAPPAGTVPRSGRARSLAAALLLMAAGGLAIAAVRTILPASVEDGPIAAADGPAVRAADAFRTFALDPTHPVETSATDRAVLESWLSGRVGLPIRAPDLRDAGWTLLGGRATPGESGPAAFLVYESGAGQRLGLYVSRATALTAAGAVVRATPGGGSTLSWTSGPAAYVVAVGRPDGWMRRNASALEARIEGEANRGE